MERIETKRYRLADRRTRPTTLWSALRWQGWRHSCRRAGEGRHVYVDCLVWRSVELALLVIAGSVLDACLTLLHLDDGGSEANLLMHLALALAPTVFVVPKLSLTGLAVWWLAAHQHFPLAARSLHRLTLGYGVVLVYHLILSLRLVEKEHLCSTTRAILPQISTHTGRGTRGPAAAGRSPCG